jgi:hypothetical protein
MARMMRDAGQALDHLGHARQRPQRGREPVRRGPGAQGRFDPPQVLGPQAGLAPRAADGLQALATLGAPCLVPVIGGGCRDAQLPSHGRLRDAARKQLRGLKPACFQGRKIPTGSALGRWHESAWHRTREIH